jgi:hypothetical protein
MTQKITGKLCPRVLDFPENYVLDQKIVLSRVGTIQVDTSEFGNHSDLGAKRTDGVCCSHHQAPENIFGSRLLFTSPSHCTTLVG